MSARRRRRAVPIVLLIAAIVVLVAIVLARPPAWWTPIESTDAAATERGEQFENACLSEAHRVRADKAPWAVFVRDDDVNAWLATRLPKWLEHAGVSGVASAQIRFTEGQIDVAAELPDVPSIGVISVTPALANGTLRAERIGAAIGRLPLPFAQGFVLGPLLRALGGSDAPGELKIVAALLDGRGVAAEFELTDGRRVRLRDIEIHSQEMLLEFETLPRER